MRALRAAALFVVAFAGSSSAPPNADAGDPGWHYVLPVDHGIRVDRGGKGHFLAPRRHGRHNGLDLLAPIGTPVHAVCGGQATAGRRGSFGIYVHLVCKLPSTLTGGEPLYASIFHAHLQKKTIAHGEWVSVKPGQLLGAVGKTGNAIGPTIMPHLHFEFAVHPTLEAAQKERHSGRNQSNNNAADRFFDKLSNACLEPDAFRSDYDVRRARRADPFMVLTCLSVDKPTFTAPKEPLDDAATRWSTHYEASFDVDQGR
jgi:murein DD-endopeptidase MepM/ murein hydrolase activator NlpD